MSTTSATTVLSRPAPGARRPRLRWLDAVRAAALLVVVAGHTLQAVVHVGHDGQPALSALLDQTPAWTHWLTWPLQVMPAFFAVGAYAAAASLAERRITDRRAWATWTAGRLRRLIVPALPLLAVWAALTVALRGVVDADLLRIATSTALVPLWFLAVYVVVQALIPVWIALLDGGRRWWVLVAALVATAAVVDLAHLSGLPAVGYVNFVAVWSVPTLLGVAAQRGLVRGWDLLVLVVAAAAGAAALLAWAGYEVPVVGLTGAERGNNSPPTLLLAAHGTLYTAVVLGLAPRVEGWVGATARRRTVLATAAAWSMPLYLWHMTAMVALIGATLVGGVPGLSALVAADPLTGTWWALRPVWIAVVGGAAVGLLAVVRRPTAAVVAWSSRRIVPDGPARVAVAVAGVTAGIGAIVLGGFGALFVPAWLLAGAVWLLHAAPRVDVTAEG
ncbi:acyltransferase family protein [Euzebya sp.]|uniref:acyltransferase family protein n=1 Tax=Euzebya sp. TaxID=1971409 RepID=UPI00351978A1